MKKIIKVISVFILIFTFLPIYVVNATNLKEQNNQDEQEKNETTPYSYLEYNKSERLFQNPNNYYQIQNNKIKISGGDYVLTTSSIGLKVCKVNQKLLGTTSGYYSNKTKKAVKKFQKKKKLKQTGKVDYKTWKKLGFSKNDWKYLSTYVTPLKIEKSSTKSELIQAMLDTAYEYKNAKTKYLVGCSGKPGTYVDCSGLIFQCLYSAGIKPKLTIVDHCKLKYEYTSNYFSKDNKLGRVITKKSIKKGKETLKKGDLIFYGNPVNHVGIYVGGGKVIDSTPQNGGVKKRTLTNNYTMVIRVFETEAEELSNSDKVKVKINTTNKTYTGKEIKPQVIVTYRNTKLNENIDYKLIYSNNIKTGKATIKIEGIGNIVGTIKDYFYIVPKITDISYLKNSSKGKVKIKWKKDSMVSGYEIYMSTNKNSGYKKIKSITSYKTTNYIKTKLKKKKTYYFKIRTYKKVGNKKIYSSYSSIKSIKIKK